MATSPARRRSARRKRAYHHGDLRRALLDAAIALIEKRGVAALSLREVARRAGVSHAAPAHHFGDLRGLHRAIAEEGFAALRDHMLAAARGVSDPAEALRRFGIAYVDFAVRNPGRFRAMFHPLVADRGDASLAGAADAAFDVLLSGLRALQPAPALGRRALAEHALAAWAPMHGLAALAVDRQLEGKGLATTNPVALARLLSQRPPGGRTP